MTQGRCLWSSVTQGRCLFRHLPPRRAVASNHARLQQQHACPGRCCSGFSHGAVLSQAIRRAGPYPAERLPQCSVETLHCGNTSLPPGMPGSMGLPQNRWCLDNEVHSALGSSRRPSYGARLEQVKAAPTMHWHATKGQPGDWLWS